MEENTPLSILYNQLLQQIKKFPNEPFQADLLKRHLSLTNKKPRYFENTTEHRIKLRIAICIFLYVTNAAKPDCSIFPEIWNILLNENNQLNITYIYEYILGKYEPKVATIMDKLNEVSLFLCIYKNC